MLQADHSEETERGKWQKTFIKKAIKDIGLTHTDAMGILGLVCEERQKAYMQGYDKGYNDVKGILMNILSV